MKITQSPVKASLKLTASHYENFPVASFLLPKRLREPVALIYAFARQADDFADEGDLLPEQRIALINEFKAELDLIEKNKQPNTELFIALKDAIHQHQLPIKPFYDLLDAFSQDVSKTRYQDFGEVMSYCRRSANPVGRMMLSLYQADSDANVGMADALCSALQLINFLQDIAIDIQKNRIYLPQDELEKYKITEAQIIRGDSSGTWSLMMEFQINRARKLLQAGAPLGLVLPGRIGLEMRMIIAGGERILKKLHQAHGNVFDYRPKLTKKDWLYMAYRAISKK
ncbi:squalene synthase HpnC [Candidatus Methylopumilus turicensis]|uniref:Squalene/phytoene synthase n=1 Tax=Candidatus Methylopumilus turicensis TaxID=1581680 RepID=A0A0B7IXJ3_9PROT|nr:squalene synthase HpnC [Candidatus Methylopumilus turicensis]CEN55833.1 Squalene/phytoene synthase [Candidatus Methylopumilus turicensis]